MADQFRRALPIALACATVASCGGPLGSRDVELAELCDSDIDCGPASACVAGACAVVEDPECTADSHCADLSLCAVDGTERCLAGRCRFTPKTCETPPASACVASDSVFVTYATQGSCDVATGECVYARAESNCPSCAATCLAQCSGLSCDDRYGGCWHNGLCSPGSPASCSYEVLANGAACRLASDAADQANGHCSNGYCEGCRAALDCPTGWTCESGACAPPVSDCPLGAGCDDGKKETYNDKCDAVGECHGTPITCTNDTTPCGARRTPNGTATCAVTYPGASTSCVADSDPCTVDHCNGAGACVADTCLNGVCYAGLGCAPSPTFTVPSEARCADLGVAHAGTASDALFKYVVTGPVGAHVVKYNRHTSCAGASYSVASETPASPTDPAAKFIGADGTYTFLSGNGVVTNCEGGGYGGYDSYAVVGGRTTNVAASTLHNSRCYDSPANRNFKTCQAAASYCSACNGGAGCSTAGQYCDVYNGGTPTCVFPSIVATPACADLGQAHSGASKLFEYTVRGPEGARVHKMNSHTSCGAGFAEALETSSAVARIGASGTYVFSGGNSAMSCADSESLAGSWAQYADVGDAAEAFPVYSTASTPVTTVYRNSACAAFDTCVEAGNYCAGVDPCAGCTSPNVCYPGIGCAAAPTFTSHTPCADSGVAHAGTSSDALFKYVVTGPVGAHVVKYNRHTSCAGSSWNAAPETPASATDPGAQFIGPSGTYTFLLGNAPVTHCEGGSYGRYESYATVAGVPTSGTSFGTYFNSQCYAEFNSCSSAASYCSPCNSGAGCTTAGQYCDSYGGAPTCRYPRMEATACADLGYDHASSGGQLSEYRVYGPAGALVHKFNNHSSCGGGYAEGGETAAGNSRIGSNGVYLFQAGSTAPFSCGDSQFLGGAWWQYAVVGSSTEPFKPYSTQSNAVRTVYFNNACGGMSTCDEGASFCGQ